MQDWQHMRRDLILYFITYFFLFSFLMRGFFSVGLCLENEFYFSRFCPGVGVGVLCSGGLKGVAPAGPETHTCLRTRAWWFPALLRPCVALCY